MSQVINHTRGPWIVQQSHRKVPVIVGGLSGNTGLIASTGMTTKPHAEKLANAYLISAAPDLLEACRAAERGCACSIMERNSGHRTDCYVPELQQAIAKSEGRP